MTNTIFELPVSVLYQVLNDWLPLECLGRLDSASSRSPQLRVLFLQFLSSPENIFSAECLSFSSMLYLESYVNWVVLRSVKVSNVQIPLLRDGVPKSAAVPFFKATGQYIKQITSDAEDNASLVAVYPCMQATCSNLEVLVINHPSSASDVIKILAICHASIRELCLQGCSGPESNYLDRIYCPNMRSVCIEGEGFAGQFVSTVLQGCPNLEVLQCARLTRCPAPEGLRFISDISNSYPHLRVLDVSKSCITDVGLAKLVQFCPNITSFTAIRCSSLTDIGVASLTVHCKFIEELCVCCNAHLTNESLVAIASSYSATLTSLDVGECSSITCAGVASAVAQCRLLKSLKLAGYTRLSEAQLLSCIQCSSELEDLVLDSSDITDQVLRAAEENCPLLRRLSLMQSGSFTARGVHALLKQATQLRELVVSSQSTVVNELSAILIEESYPHVKVTRDSRAHRRTGTHTTYDHMGIEVPFHFADAIHVPTDMAFWDELLFD